MREVQRYLDTPDAQTMCVIDPGIRQRLLRHLENCVAEIDTDISPNVVATPPQEKIYKDVLVEKRIPISTIAKCEPATISTISNDMMFNRMEVDQEQEKKVRLEPDSSTAEEINNNAETNFRNEDGRIEEGVQHVTALPNNVIKMYDGNFVFVLPSHYIQLAAALGINLNNQVNSVPIPETNSTPEASGAQVESQVSVSVNAPEKPLDFSKNNEVNDMWRPW